jgi:hypothetical protein
LTAVTELAEASGISARKGDDNTGRANYKKGHHTRIGDSSLYARNDEGDNARNDKDRERSESLV